MARDFDTSQSLKNAGILDVFQVFQTEELEQKIRQQPQTIYSAVTQGVNFMRGDVGIAPYEQRFHSFLSKTEIHVGEGQFE